MCGRYVLNQDEEALAKKYKLKYSGSKIKPNYNVAPGHTMPIIISENDTKKIVEAKWGFVPVWAKDPNIGYKLINSRSEGIFEKPMWRGPILKHRAVIPATGFYEWQKLNGVKSKGLPKFIELKNHELMNFAGLWEVWKDAEGIPRTTYSIITTSPNKEMSTVHDRMPVILDDDEVDHWLDSDLNKRDQIEEYLAKLPDNSLSMYTVSDEVNFVRNNSEDLLQKIGDE